MNSGKARVRGALPRSECKSAACAAEAELGECPSSRWDGEPIDGFADEVAELKGGGMGMLMKFDYAKEKFFISDDEVPLGREFVAHCGSYARGWTKFIDKRPVDVKVLKVNEGQPPTRDKLDEPELADTENDPWVFQRYLPLEDPDSGEVIIFVSKSTGGKIALGDLLDTYQHNTPGLPMIKLPAPRFNTKSFGPKPQARVPDQRLDRRQQDREDDHVADGAPGRLFDPEDPLYDDFMK